MKIMAINGSPGEGGFTGECLASVSAFLKEKEAEVQPLNLRDVHIEDCRGCFHCLRTGTCPLEDDMSSIQESMLATDGFVVASPVRNGLTTACYKRFYERITYMLAFPLLLENKYTLGISSVGCAGGKKVNRRLVGLQDVARTHLTDFLFFKVGIPRKLKFEAIKPTLEQAAQSLIDAIKNRRPRTLKEKLSFALDRMVMSRLMFKKDPENFAFVINSWRRKGYLG